MSENLPHSPARPPSMVNPQILQSLRLARASQAFLAALPKPPELWETLLLSHSQRMFLRCWLDLRIRRVDSDAVSEAEKAVVDRLEDLRRDNGPWMAGLRVFLSNLPGVPTDGERFDVVLALLAISAPARESALHWIADPSASRSAATEEMARMHLVGKAYLMAMGNETARIEKGSETGPRPETQAEQRIAALQAEPHSAITRILPRGVKMETLEDVGRVDDCRKILKEFDPEVQLWECFCLVMADDASRQSIDELVRRKKATPAQTFTQGAESLFERLQEIRKEHAAFVRQLAAFLSDLPVGQYAVETRELALGFIVAGQVGRSHAAQWLSNPAHYRQEAATRFEGLIGRAMNYQTALRTFAEG